MRGIGIVGAMAASVVLAYGLREMANVFVPLVVAVFLSMLGIAPLNWLIVKGIPRIIAVIGVFCAVMLSFLGIAFLIASSVSGFMDVVPDYSLKIDELLSKFMELLAKLGIRNSSNSWIPKIEPSSIFDVFSLALSSILDILSKSTVVAFYLVFILLEASQFKEKMSAAFENKFETDVIDRVVRDAQNYIVVKTGVNLIWGTAVWIAAVLFQLPFAGFWGLITFLFCFVPVLGSILSLVPPVLLSFVEMGYVKAMLFLFILLAIHIIVGNIVEPIFIGKNLDLSPFVAFFAISFWGWIWGLTGMLLSVPLTMMLKLCFEHTRDLHWLSILMGTVRASSVKQPAVQKN